MTIASSPVAARRDIDIPLGTLGLWRRSALAFVAGAGTALALPPFDIIPAILGYGVLALLLTPVSLGWRGGAAVGAAFGFGYHLAGLWWVGAAFLVDAETFGALLPLGVLGLPLGLSLFHAVAGALVCALAKGVIARALALAAALTLTEFARATVLTGFPWNAPGMGLTGWLPLAQPAAWIGLPGLNLAAVWVGASWACLWAPERWRFLALSGPAVIAAFAAVGLARLQPPVVVPDDAPRIRIVQPNIPQADKWRPELRDAIWSQLLADTASAGPTDVVVWPETAIPFLYAGEGAREQLSAALGEGRWLITGAVETTTVDGARRFTNSMLVIAPSGRVVQRYDKLHLVPFGEYVPFGTVLSSIGFRALVNSASAFVAGKTWTPLEVPGLPLAEPLVCYEVIFSRPVPHNVGVIVNVTNDAWFGDTPGPHQHLRHTVLRAIDRGVPIIRAANTGISAMISPRGEIMAEAALGEYATLDVRLPGPGNATFNNSLFKLIPLIMSVFLLVAVALSRRLWSI